MKSTRIPMHTCLECGRKMDAASSAEGKAPRDDGTSLSICGYCGAAAVYGKGFVLEPVDVAKLGKRTRTQIYDFWRAIGRPVP